MVRLEFQDIDRLKQIHFDALKSYVKDRMRDKDRDAFYRSVVQLPGFKGFPESFDVTDDTYEWLRIFVLADYLQIKDWVKNVPANLKFDHMRKVYINYFSNGSKNFVDSSGTYNAYTLFREMGIKVCPYCEHEFLDEVQVSNGTQEKRTIEFDHFYPKGDNSFPALAMCFYNLVPSCKACNQIKMSNPLGANPYDPDIEKMTFLYPNLPIGTNMETVDSRDCDILLHSIGPMAVNNETLALEQRYKNVSPEVYRLLKTRQQFPDSKLEELERMGYGSKESFLQGLFGNPRTKAKGSELHTKMKQDLIGW
ncbi:MAG: hypothetical protein IJZ86_09520 [Bacteroides sp.]|nr:hypothetical protein [Bacteroides sp.]